MSGEEEKREKYYISSNAIVKKPGSSVLIFSAEVACFQWGSICDYEYLAIKSAISSASV